MTKKRCVYLRVKRIQDTVLSALALVRLYKFRTMCVGAEQRLSELLPYNEMTGPAFKI